MDSEPSRTGLALPKSLIVARQRKDEEDMIVVVVVGKARAFSIPLSPLQRLACILFRT